jgi:hypothetical protein
MDYGFRNWIVLMATIIVAVLGLLLAGKSEDEAMTLAGSLFFLFGAAFAIRIANQMAVGRWDS